MPLNCNQIAVVIPIYKVNPSREEKISIDRAFSILNNYKFYFVAPQNLDLTNYEKYFIYSPGVIRFNNSYFNDGLEGYNQLLLSKMFYSEFSSCKFILIYQPDAYVFRDDLMQWCMKGYDYIAAPWLENRNGKIALNGVGNGGFSLRKVESFLNILSLCEIQTIFKASRIKRKIYKYLNKTIKWRIRLLSFTGNKKVVFYREPTFHEDGFWGLSAPTITKRYKTAPGETALKFSFDTHPEILYQMNQYQLPFGCHAWITRNPAFWKKHIHS